MDSALKRKNVGQSKPKFRHTLRILVTHKWTNETNTLTDYYVNNYGMLETICFLFKSFIQAHLEDCLKVPLPCPNKCDKKLTIPREELDKHIEVDCPRTKIVCQFEEIGCPHRVRY